MKSTPLPPRPFLSFLLGVSFVLGSPADPLALAQESAPPPGERSPGEKGAAPGAGGKTKGRPKGPPSVPEPDRFAPLSNHLSLADAMRHRDFPDTAWSGLPGEPWVLSIEHSEESDILHLSAREGNDLVPKARIGKPGVLHQPAITGDGDSGIWAVWGQVNRSEVMTLRAIRFTGEEAGEEIELAAAPDAGNSFADAATDAAGRVWVAWQEIRPGASRILARHWSEARGWSETIRVSDPEAQGGNWEPRLAVTDAESAWIVYDSSAGGEFNLRLARVTTDGAVEDRVLLETPEYEARAAIAADGAGGLWIAAERGNRQWGLDSRGHENAMGLNAGKRLLLGHYDPERETFTEVPVPANGRPTPSPDPSPGFAVNVPSLAVHEGRVWIAYRYFSNQFWRGALTFYDPAADRWAEPAALPDSTMGQDRHQELALGSDGALWVTWPTDRRATKAPGIAEIHLAQVETSAEWPLLPAEEGLPIARSPDPRLYLDETTPPRPLSEHHAWTVGGKTYHLLWGDLHRHTDISNCRTGFDGCILEAYRYAYDVAGLDFLGTSDHTDIGKVYSPYEWWHTQRQVDVFYAPGHFASLYAYEREQTFPWGHRNIVFANRGGPLVHIKRANYRNSPWQGSLPLPPGLDDIHPSELWDVLKRHGKPCAIISHTGATGMGTDWTRYEEGIDNTHENLVEIFQGARVSYEGLGTPQPTVGLRRNEPYTPSALNSKDFPAPPAPIEDFEAGQVTPAAYNNGVYQKSLSVGHRLGVFASSDHISTHTSFGGVYVEDFSREGILAGFKARRTCAATDKIFVELSCGERLMGEVFEVAENPALRYAINGTAAVKRLTIIRNESDHHVINPGSAEVSGTWTDPAPLEGENRYYLRVEQSDGNMAWSSPLWITVKAGEAGD